MLRDVVYDYLWTQIREKQFKPGEFVNLNLISQKLGVSRTPLREALIVLEAEGFVQILPKRGIYIKPLTLQDTYNLYEAIGALESSIIMSVWSKIDENFIRTLERINGEIAACTDYARHYELNHEFHFAYINLSENTEIKNYLGRLTSASTISQASTTARSSKATTAPDTPNLSAFLERAIPSPRPTT